MVALWALSGAHHLEHATPIPCVRTSFLLDEYLSTSSGEMMTPVKKSRLVIGR